MPGTHGSCAPLLAPAPWNALQSLEHVLSQEDTVPEQQRALWRWGLLCQNGGRQKAAALGVCSPAQPHLLLAVPVTLPKVVSFYTDPATLPKANPLN